MKRTLPGIIAIALALAIVFSFAWCIADAPHPEHQTHHAIRASAAQRQGGAPVVAALARVEARAMPGDVRISCESVAFSADSSRRLQLLDVLRV
jgi:hypothetical protein